MALSPPAAVCSFQSDVVVDECALIRLESEIATVVVVAVVGRSFEKHLRTRLKWKEINYYVYGAQLRRRD